MPEPLLDVRALDAFYGDFQALFGVSLRVPAGEVVAVIGANGAGKSTLLKCIAGVIASRRDAILFDGEPIGDEPAHAVVARGIALVPEGRRLSPRSRSRRTSSSAASSAGAGRGACRESTSCFRCWPSAGTCRAPRSPAASSRWSRSAAR
jgi:ABC-type branched-subunit amino acid transport system ATPase component